MSMFLITLVSATNIGIFKQNTEMQITNFCSTGDCTYANLTSIILPSGTVNYINEFMTQTENDFNYTYTPTQIGTYTFKTCSNPEGASVCESDTFEVTPNGFINNIGFYIMWIILSLGIIYFGYKFEDYWIVILGGFSLVLFGLYVLFYGIVGLKDPVYTWGVGIITLMLGAYFGVRASLEQLE